MIKFSGLCGLILYSLTSFGQVSENSSSAILHELHKLQNPTRVLYLAAHPDDENTRMISWLVNEVGANTAYLALTRGDGGQNLIGTELGAKLGVLRTQELMQARTLDGGHQFFSRAVDFGYSKSAKETLEKWGEDAVLEDVVWVIRKFRPDVIITRFPPDGRGGHGHHTASALLGIKAFDLAADPKFAPEQLEFVKTWQPKRMYWNTSIWWNKGLDTVAAGNPDFLTVNVGGYNPVIGMSNNELASLSRTSHKSQGFGVSVDRGSQEEYLQYLKGEKAANSLFEGIDQSWGRYDFKEGAKLLSEIIEDFDPSAPHQSVTDLLQLRAKAEAIKDERQRKHFRGKVDEILQMALGFHAELLAPEQYLQKGEKVQFRLEAINRAPVAVTPVSLLMGGRTIDLPSEILENEAYQHSFDFAVNQEVSQPYWLEKPYENLFSVDDQKWIGKPENGPAIEGKLKVKVDGVEVEWEVPATYKFSDRVEGEIIRPVFVVPPVVVSADQDNLIFVNEQALELELKLRFFKEEATTLKLEAPGWEVQPATVTLDPEGKSGGFETVKLKVAPTKNGQSEKLVIKFENADQAQSLTEIRYSHIDDRIVLEPAEVNLIRVDLKKEGQLIGYIPGAGDEVAKAISLMGYTVVELNEEQLRQNDLSRYDAIVAGIRAYNTQEWLPSLQEKLMDYVQNGGLYLVQYNTASRDLLSKDIGPYPFEITRNRVTEEDAKVNFALPGHPVLNQPNELTPKDFEDWVQERGLYFAGNYDPKYLTPLAWHDEDEEMQSGGLLIGDYGKGAFIYTGISFFRELPAGVPGAYRLLANLLSYRNPTATSTNEQ